MDNWKASHSVSKPISVGITAPARAGSLEGIPWAPWGITRFSSSLSILRQETCLINASLLSHCLALLFILCSFDYENDLTDHHCWGPTINYFVCLMSLWRLVLAGWLLLAWLTGSLSTINIWLGKFLYTVLLAICRASYQLVISCWCYDSEGKIDTRLAHIKSHNSWRKD